MPPITALSSVTPSPCTAASKDIIARSKRSAKRSGRRSGWKRSNQSDHCTTLTVDWISGTCSRSAGVRIWCAAMKASLASGRIGSLNRGSTASCGQFGTP